MFKRLRNRFLILNMTIISIVMIVAFTTIYITTYNNMLTENKQRLESGRVIKEGEASFDASGPLEGKGDPGITEKRVTIRQISPVDSLSFNIMVNENGEILSIQSFYQMPEEAFQQAAKLAWENQKDFSVIKIEGKEWMYAIKPFETFQISYKDEEAYYSKQSTGNHQIVFLDVTDSNQTLFSLFTTLLAIGLVMLFVILAVSYYFASRAIRPIAKAWEKQKQFVTDASHELKTPLTIISSNYGALLENQDETVRSQMKWLNYIGIGTDRMSKLINDLLDLARMDDGNENKRFEIFDMGNMVIDLLQSMEAAILEKNVNLLPSIAPDIIVNGDYDKVLRVIQILLDNAIKYTDSSGFIEVTLTKVKHRVRFSVKNSGKGIPKEDMARVFDRFYRADPSRTGEQGGYGLGLSIAKTIADRLGGKLNVRCVENESTTFTFTFKATP